MKKLISHSDYEDIIDIPSVSDSEFRQKSRKHRELIKQPLTLGMFIPTDENGFVIEFEKDTDYQQAKQRVLFEGFEFKEQDEETTFISNRIIKIYFSNNEIEFETNDYNGYLETIKDLIPYNLTLAGKI